jgi:lysophospholipase L1-like esterase
MKYAHTKSKMADTITSPRHKLLFRLAVLLLVGGWLIAGMAAYLYFAYAKPIGSGPAGPQVPRDTFAKPWTTRHVLLVGIGDSVTAGFGVPSKYSYFNRLANNPEDDFDDLRGICLSAVLPNLQAKNIAVSGSTSLRHLDLVREQLSPQNADIFGLVVMTTGGNDLIHDYGRSKPREGAMYGATLEQAKPWIENFASRLNDMLDLLKKRFSGGCMVFIADIYDPTDGQGDAKKAGLPDWPDGVAIHRMYNEVIRLCAEQRPYVHVVPMCETFLGHGIHCVQPWQPHYRSDDPHYWYAWNLEDPNIRGYDAIRRLLLIEIAKQAGAFPKVKPNPYPEVLKRKEPKP